MRDRVFAARNPYLETVRILSFLLCLLVPPLLLCQLTMGDYHLLIPPSLLSFILVSS